jgi:anti-anti-sigma factor
MDPGTDIPVRLAFSVRARGGCTVVALSGILDLVSAPVLREQLLGLLGPHTNRLVIDLSKVSACDTSGLAVLVGAGRRARWLGGILRLAAPTPAVVSVLSSTGLGQGLDIFPSVFAATTGTHEFSAHQPTLNEPARHEPPRR